ncbi:MAG TPA: nuclear transport factor 2 family protein [Terriglobales bacterium]|nr:nuclear transport factor 2 family protein [Terriglobales bacterium]
MHRFILFLVVMAISPLLGIASTSSPASLEDSIRHVLEGQVQAWNRHNLEAFMNGYWNSPDLTFFSGGQVAQGWDQALARYRKRYQGEGHEMGKLNFSDLRIEPLGANAAFVRGAWHLTTSDGKNPHGLFTLIFRKFPEGWKIVHDHTSGD